jgi:hypothetical protein
VNDDLMWFDPQMMGEDDPSLMPKGVWLDLQATILLLEADRDRG